MEQKEYVRCDAAFHSALHAKNVEHIHNRGVQTLSSYQDRGESIEVVLSFDEEKVAGWLDLSPEHRYNFSKEIRVPNIREGRLVYDSYHNSIGYYDEHINYMISNLIEKNYATKIDINPLLDEIQAKRAMFDSPEAKAIIEEARREASINAEKNAQHQAENSRLYAEREAEKAKIEAEKAERTKRFEEFKKAWIPEHGSERLKKGFAKGYNCHKSFIVELMKSLNSDFIIDYNGDVSTKNRSCPSLKALEIEEEYEKIDWIKSVSIKWLPNEFNDLEPEYCEPVEGCEAVEIEVDGHYAYLRI